MLTYEASGNVAVITLRRPEARNAVNGEMASRIEEAIDRLEADETVRIAVLAAEGPAFCAGADLKGAAAGTSHGTETKRGGFAGFVLREREKPIVAAVEGPALAGGCEIVLACDLVVSSVEAVFGLPEVKRGLIAAAGGLTRLASVVGRTRAMEIALTGEPMSATLAHSLGIVNRLVSPGSAVDAAVALAESVAANAPLAVRETRKLIWASLHNDERNMRQLTAAALQRLSQTNDFHEGPMAFVEKRSPVWTAT